MNIIDDLGLITVFLLILLSGFLLLHKTENRAVNALFAIFLLVTSFDFSALFLGSFYRQYEAINQLRLASVFLQMPLFFFYVKKSCFYDFNIKWHSVLHAIPFFLFATIYLSIGINAQVDLWYAILSQVQFYIYAACIFYLLLTYKRIHSKKHSFQNETFQWLMTTSVLFVLGNSLVLFRGIFEALNDFKSLPLLNVFISFFGLFVVTWFVLKTMRNPEIFTQVHLYSEEKKILSNSSSKEDKYYLDRLESYLKKEKPYLNENITLKSLAAQANIPEKHLSFLINKVLGKHFFDYINHYRIEDAKRLLLDPNLNIQQVMFEVGFNSKSSLNTAFKKFTTYTPSEFRKRHT